MAPLRTLIGQICALPPAHLGSTIRIQNGYRTSVLSCPLQRVIVIAVTGQSVTSLMRKLRSSSARVRSGRESNSSTHHHQALPDRPHGPLPPYYQITRSLIFAIAGYRGQAREAYLRWVDWAQDARKDSGPGACERSAAGQMGLSRAAGSKRLG